MWTPSVIMVVTMQKNLDYLQASKHINILVQGYLLGCHQLTKVAQTCYPKIMSLFSMKKWIPMIFRVFLQHFTGINSTSIIQPNIYLYFIDVGFLVNINMQTLLEL